MSIRTRLAACLAAPILAAMVLAGCGGGTTEVPAATPAAAQSNLPPFNFEIRTLSNRADLISDGNALVEVSVPKNVPMKKVTLTLNGVDVGSAFTADEAARTFRGVVTGLKVGANTLIADSNGNGNGRPWASLTITNHERGGPILLGSQTQPWVCATPTPVAESGNTPASNASGLSTFAVDAKCNIKTEYKLFYRTTTAGCSTALPDPSPPSAQPTNNCFKPYTPGTTPADLATTTTNAGADGAVHRARRARHDQPRHLRHRGAVRSDPRRTMDGARAAVAMERQGALQLRRVDRPAAPAVPHRAELGRRRRARRAASWSSTTA